MPMTTDQMDVAIRTLQARVDRLAMVSNEQARRIEALEKPNLGAQMEALVAEVKAIADAAHGPYGGRQ